MSLDEYNDKLNFLAACTAVNVGWEKMWVIDNFLAACTAVNAAPSASSLPKYFLAACTAVN